MVANLFVFVLGSAIALFFWWIGTRPTRKPEGQDRTVNSGRG